MKNHKQIIITWITIALVLAVFLPGNGLTEKDKRIPLVAKIVFPPEEDKVYDIDNPEEAISLNLLLKNVSGKDVWTREGFDDQDFHFYLFLYGPLEKNPKLITSASGKIGGSSTPSLAPDKVAVEELNSRMPPELKAFPWAKKIYIPELRDYYNLKQSGTYKLWFAMSFEQYNPVNLEAVDENKDGEVDRYFIPFNDRLWGGVIEYKEEYITLKTSTPAKRSNVRVTVPDKILGTLSHSGVTKLSRDDDDFVLRLYSRSAWEAIYGPVNFRTFRAIATDAQMKSEALVARLVDPDKGEFLFRDVKQVDCIIIGNAGRETEYKYLWAPIKADDTRWGKKEISVKLQLLMDIKDIRIFGKK